MFSRVVRRRRAHTKCPCHTRIMNGLQEKEDNWKQFLGSELGTVLSGIYGNQRPKINYPAPKKKTFDPAKHKFLPVNGHVNNVQHQDPRKTTRRDTRGKVSVPTGFKGEASANRGPFDPMVIVPSRKGYNEIKKEMEYENSRQRAYRPPVNTYKIGEDEKERFGQICAYKGGKGLMQGAIDLPRDKTPYELAQNRRRIEQEANFKSTRRLGPNASRQRGVSPITVPPASSTSGASCGQEDLHDQIVTEINERADYLEEMEALGELSKAEKKRLQGEIRSRTLELERLKI